jgi:prepilin-type N-terminal cleavage/methylation domain-containing protein
MRTRPGFTLLELLLATVLSVVLMMGVLAVLTDLSTDSQTFQASPSSEPAVQGRVLEALAELLRGDLSHAQSIEATEPNEILLRGSGALDNRARSRTHRPVEVRYELREIDGRQWLLRRQRALDVLSNRNVQRDLVCTGIRKFELVAQGGVALSGAQGPAETTRDERGVPVPSGVGGGGSARKPDNQEAGGEPKTSEPTVPAEPETDETRDELRTYYDPKTKEVSVMVNGLWYYPRYAPRWAQRQYRDQTGREDPGPAGDGSVSAGRSDRDGAGPGSEGSTPSSGVRGSAGGPEDAPPPPAVMSITWRLRVWTRQQEEPVYDEIVAVQLGAGQ